MVFCMIVCTNKQISSRTVDITNNKHTKEEEEAKVLYSLYYYIELNRDTRFYIKFSCIRDATIYNSKGHTVNRHYVDVIWEKAWQKRKNTKLR